MKFVQTKYFQLNSAKCLVSNHRYIYKSVFSCFIHIFVYIYIYGLPGFELLVMSVLRLGPEEDYVPGHLDAVSPALTHEVNELSQLKAHLLKWSALFLPFEDVCSCVFIFTFYFLLFCTTKCFELFIVVLGALNTIRHLAEKKENAWQKYVDVLCMFLSSSQMWRYNCTRQLHLK